MNLNKILEKICSSSGLFSYLVKFLIRNLDLLFNFNPEFLVKTNATVRPNYAYCIYHSSILAKKLGYTSISFIEFGVAGGNGLIFIEKFANRIKKNLDINIEIYGFDLGEGLSKPKDFRDLPYWFKEGFYKMDLGKLKKKLTCTKLIIGDVNVTLNTFFDKTLCTYRRYISRFRLLFNT